MAVQSPFPGISQIKVRLMVRGALQQNAWQVWGDGLIDAHNRGQTRAQTGFSNSVNCRARRFDADRPARQGRNDLSPLFYTD